MSDIDPTKTELEVTAHPTGITRQDIEDLDVRIARSEKMADALDKMRALAIKRTVPGDWRKFGDTYYLEGDGATRIAPVIGLEMTNTTTTRELVEGIMRVTVKADFSSSIFGTKFENVQRTRAMDDAFLSQQGTVEPDLGDLENAAYKGCLARGAQLVAGLAGLTAKDLWEKYGLKVDAEEVRFQKGAAAAGRSAAKDPAEEADRILHKLCEGDAEAVASVLFKLTDNPTKGFTGSKTVKTVRAGAWSWLLPRIQEMEKKYDSDQEKSLSGADAAPAATPPPKNGVKK